MVEPRTSILLPTHNRADLLGFAIQSILWQSDADFELLIVGDGCIDKTADVVASFADERIRWFDLPKAPLSGYANRNVALRAARGKYIAYSQDDDLWLPDHLQRLIATVDASGCDWGYSRPLWVARDGFIFPFAVDLTQADQLDNFLNKTNTIPSSPVLHRRDALERVGYWPEDVPRIADWRCWQQIILKSSSGRAAYCPEPTVLHFRAHWKTEEGGLEKSLRAIAETASWWPRACRVPVVPGIAEQRIAFASIQADPVVWVDRLRRGVIEVTDRLAWGWVFTPMQSWPGPQSLVDEVRALKDKRARLKSRLVAADESNERLKECWTSPSALARQLFKQLMPSRGLAGADGATRNPRKSKG